MLCSPHYTAVQIKSTSVIKVATMKLNMMVPIAQVIIWNWSVLCPSLSAMFNLLHSSMNQELFEEHLCNQGSYYEKYRQFPLHTGSHHVLPPNQHLSLSAKMNGTQRSILGNSLKNALHVLRYAKRHLLGWSNVKQQKKSSL